MNLLRDVNVAFYIEFCVEEKKLKQTLILQVVITFVGIIPYKEVKGNSISQTLVMGYVFNLTKSQLAEGCIFYPKCTNGSILNLLPRLYD